jgi:nucleoside diphosphate kinase
MVEQTLIIIKPEAVNRRLWEKLSGDLRKKASKSPLPN